MSAFEIGGARCEPGAFARGKLLGGYRDDGSPITIPVLILNGGKPGPVLWLGSTVHGIEIVGAEIIRRVMREVVNPAELSGTIVGAPIQNPEAFLSGTRSTPRDGGNVNRVFPGKRNGSLSERLASVLWQEGLSRADVVVDFHGNIPPAVPFVVLRGGEDEVAKRSLRLAEAYGLTIFALGNDAAFMGLMTDAALAAGKPGFCVEYETWTLDERWVRAGVTGTLNLLKQLGMLPGMPEPVEGITPIREPLEELVHHVRLKADYGGLILPLVAAGERVTTGQPVARIVDPYGDEMQVLRSPAEGYVLRYPRRYNQTAGTGDDVVVIAQLRM